jgi:hypothetical protein
MRIVIRCIGIWWHHLYQALNVRVNNASDWLSAREAARIDLGVMSPAMF